MKKRGKPVSTMRVVFVCFSRAWGGLELMHVKLATSLRDRGHWAGIVAPEETPLLAVAEAEKLPAFALSPSWRYFDVITAIRLRTIFRTHDAQVCVIGLSRDISTVVLAGSLFSRTNLVYFQQMQFGHRKRDLFHRWSYARLARWITLTNAMKASAVVNTTVPESKFRVIPFGVDLSVFDPAKHSRPLVRKKFALPARKTIVALIGRFDRQKGQEEFLRSIPGIVKREPRTHFLLVGEETRLEGGFRSYLQGIIEQLSLQDRVQFLPFTSQIAELLAAVDVLVMPSYSETFGYLAAEAMAMGIPVVGTNAGGLPEIVRHGETGFLVPPREALPLENAVVKLLRNHNLYRRLSRSSLLRAREHFDFAKHVTSLESLLSEITHPVPPQ